MIRVLVLVLPLVSILATVTSATEWARKMFEVTRHDFGAVAKNTKSEFTFKIVNPYAVDVRIAAVRSSCGCTTPRIVKRTITTYDKGGIQAIYNTNTFSGKRSTTITVTFDKPQYAEVQLTVKGDIRTDVDIQPGAISFGSIDQGQAGEQRARVRYHGMRDWKLVEVRGVNEFFNVELKTVNNVGARVYDVVARLKDNTPIGYFRDQITLVTNDSRSRLLPLQVEGRVVPPVTVSPSALFLGVVQPQQTVTKTIVVRGKQPFRIVAVRSDDSRFTFQKTESAKKFHVIPVTFTAGEKIAKVVKTIEVVTDLGDGVIANCKASAAVMESVASK